MRLRRERELLEENAALRAALERKEQKELVLCEKFGLANTRISVLTSALMDSLHTQVDLARQYGDDEHLGLSKIRGQIQVIHGQMGEDNNEYAQARLIELLNHLNGE